MKLNNGLRREVREKQEFASDQRVLKEKHGIIQDTNVIVVEKSNTIKFLFRYVSMVIRTFAKILILILAFIGLVAVVYPGPRNELITIGQDTQHQIYSFFYQDLAD